MSVEDIQLRRAAVRRDIESIQREILNLWFQQISLTLEGVRMTLKRPYAPQTAAEARWRQRVRSWLYRLRAG